MYHSLPLPIKKKYGKGIYRVKIPKNVRGHIVQLLWILSSFIHAARESGVIPIIYCQK